MSDVSSALPAAASFGIVRVEEAGLVGMVSIRGDLDDAGFRDAVTRETGAEIPGQGARTTIGDNALLWLSPDELMLTCPHEAADLMTGRLTDAFGDMHSLAVDVSDARAVFTLTGDNGALRDTLAKLTPADMCPRALGINVVRRTRLAQVPAAIWFEADDRATLVCFRSVAQYVFDLLTLASAPGSEVGHFG